MRGIRSAVAIAVVLAATFTSAVPSTAEDLCYRFAPDSAYEVSGYAWTGTVRTISKPRRSNLPREFWTFDIVFDVDQVFRNGTDGGLEPNANLVAGEAFPLRTRGCQGVRRLRPGHRYLVSTRSPGLASTSQTIAWRVDGPSAELVTGMYDVAARVEPELAMPESLAEALAVVAPRAVPDPSAAEPVKSGETHRQSMLCPSTSLGLLIQAAPGSFGGSGRLLTNRSGWAA